MTDPSTAKDLDNLQKLSYFYYISEAISGLIFLVIVAAVFVGRILFYFGAFRLILAFMDGGAPQAADTLNDELTPNAVLLPASIMLGSVIGIIGLYGVISGFYYIKFVREKKHYMYCMIISGLTATSFPVGTIIGILSIVILMKDSVRDLFNSGSELDVQPTSGQKLLSLGRYFTVYGIISVLLSFLSVIYIAASYALLTGDSDKAIVVRGSTIPVNYLITTSSILVFGLLLSFCTVIAGGLLKRRKGFVFIIVTGAFLSLFPPFGTILGVWTIFLLFSDPGRAAFRSNP